MIKYRFVGTFKRLFETNNTNRRRKEIKTVINIWFQHYKCTERSNKMQCTKVAKMRIYQIKTIHHSPKLQDCFESLLVDNGPSCPHEVGVKFAKPNHEKDLKAAIWGKISGSKGWSAPHKPAECDRWRWTRERKAPSARSESRLNCRWTFQRHS